MCRDKVWKKKRLTVQELLDRKVINDPREPVWVYLDREMRENEHIKPYNEKVGAWLEFMKDLHAHFNREALKAYRRVKRKVGPIWFLEMSSLQREVLVGLRENIAQDLVENLPIRVSQALRRLGLTIKFPTEMLLKAMTASINDPGLFIWFLYEAYYKISPCVLLPQYDVNAMMMMSSLVCIDMDECVKRLDKLLVRQQPPPSKTPKKLRKYYQPDVKFGEYLQRMYVPCPPKSILHWQKPPKPLPLEYKVKLHTTESYVRFCEDTSFIRRRIQKNLEAKVEDRVCRYRFWEPPTSLRNTDPKMAAYIEALKTFKKKARPKFLKHKPNFENVQCHLGNVTYCGGNPNYVIHNYSLMPTGYILHNGGTIKINNEYITHILGHYKFPRHIEERCESECDCITKWEPSIMEFLKDTKCICGHRYDFHHEGKAKKKYFYPPTRHLPFTIDKPKLYEMDPMEEFIKRTVKEAVKSNESTVTESEATIPLTNMKLKDLLAAILADLSDTPLIIPHLPQANCLQSLQGCINRKIRGTYISPKKHKLMNLMSQRTWRDLDHMDFRSRAYRIPFTAKELDTMDFDDAHMVKKLTNILFESFITRNRIKMIHQTRLWWSSMRNDLYPSQKFLDAFFAYMPVRMTEIFVINPHGTSLIRDVGHTCKLEQPM